MKAPWRVSGGLEVALLASACFVFSCAKMGQPPGGPEDHYGPQVVETFPAADAIGVSRKLEARIRFDEAVNRRAVENSLFFSPDPGDRFRLFWRGNKLHVRYLDSLALNRTYVVTVGSGARDIRGNPVERPFTLAFSTGNRIDRGRIWGQVAGEERPQRVSLWAYALSDSAPPNPQTTLPAYRTQPDGSGTFHFSHLREDIYRVFALSELGPDGYWNPSANRIGIPPYDVAVTDESQPYLSFRLVLQDTSSASVRGVVSKNERQLEVRFSKELSGLVSYSLETLSGDTMGFLATYEDPEDSSRWQLFSASALREGEWRLVTTLRDRSGESQRVFLDTVLVRGIQDTTRPEITKQFPRPRQRLVDAPEAVEFYFSEGVRSADSSGWFKLYSAPPADTMPLLPRWYHAAHLSLTPAKVLQRGRNYTLAYDASAISDFSGNLLGDTVWTSTFQVLPDDSLGSLLGNLSDPAGGRHVVSAWSIRLRQVVRSVSGMLPGEFALRELPAGLYLLEVLRDDDGSGDFTGGSIDPWRFSESFWSSRDTFAVRSRWDRGGIQLNFPVSQ